MLVIANVKSCCHFIVLFFFLNDPPPPEISTLPLHDALPICPRRASQPHPENGVPRLRPFRPPVLRPTRPGRDVPCRGGRARHRRAGAVRRPDRHQPGAASVRERNRHPWLERRGDRPPGGPAGFSPGPWGT